MKKLESLNSELFQSFNPENEPWIVGGTTGSTSGSFTHNNGSNDGSVDGDLDFGKNNC